MSDNEAAEQKIKKETKPRTQKQKEAFDKMIAKRKEIDEVKNAHREALRKEKEIIRKDRVKKIKEVADVLEEKQEDTEEEVEEVVKPVKSKPVKAKPAAHKSLKKKIIIQESSSESEEEPEIVYIKKSSKSSKKKKAKKKIIVKETSSESSEEEEPKHTATKLVNKKSEDQLRQDLHNEKLKSALRSLGYIE